MSPTDAGNPAPSPLQKRSTFPRSFSELVSTQLLPGNMSKSPALTSNFGVDYVIVYRYDPKDKVKALTDFESLLHKLAGVGLATEVRNGENNSLLVFVKVASDGHMFAEIYRSRVKDWIHGVRASEPAQDTEASLQEDPLTDAERLRCIRQLISNDDTDGGAGIKPGAKGFENVESVFPLHDHVFNKRWMTKWATEWRIRTEDLDEVRDRFGEKVAYYFAFEKTYFNFLTFPSVLGVLAWLGLGSFSPIYGTAVCVWCVVFVEWWKHQERDLAIRWGVLNVSNIGSKRHEFIATQEVEDTATGQMTKIFPLTERLKRQALQLPFAVSAVLILGSLIILCFAIEIFIGEIYDGPGKSFLTFTPTIILTTCLPILTGILSDIAKRLNTYENYETDAEFERSLTGKLFVLDFITSYMGIILTAFVYVPFGTILIPYLDVFSVVTKQFTDKSSHLHDPKRNSYTINPDRLRKQVIYFAVTASIVNFATEIVVPYLKRQGFLKFKEMTAKKNTSSLSASAAADDSQEEKDFLHRVRAEAELPSYDVYADLREMIIQFGYLSLFSIVWPLVPLSYLVNNFFEIRGDAVKICVEMQRPTPWRADTIGPWLDALTFLTWLGSLTMAALTYMFSNDGVGPDGSPHTIKAWALLLSIFFSEHLYLFVHRAVAAAIAKIDSPGRQKERRDRYLTREKYVQQSLSKIPRADTFGATEDTAITRETLEEDARQGSLKTASPQERFWTRQRSWKESAQMGRVYMERRIAEEGSTAGNEKKEL